MDSRRTTHTARNQHIPTAIVDDADRLSIAAHEAAALYDQGFYCSEAVLRVAAAHAGVSAPPEMLCLATGFGAGMGHSGAVCGALSGAVMAAGLLCGKSSEHESDPQAARAARKLHKRFREELGSTSCSDIIRPYGGMRGDGRHEHCREVTALCARWVLELAEESGWIAVDSSARSS